MKRRICVSGTFCLVSFFTAAVASEAEWGDLTGRLVIADTRNGMSQGAVIGVADVVIYRRGGGPVHDKLNDQLHGKVRLSIRDGVFDRTVATLWLGEQLLVIANQDRGGYAINVSPAGEPIQNPLLRGGEEIEIALYRQQNVPVPIQCNVRSSLKSYVLPRDDPYAVVTDHEGRFRLEKLPVGNLKLQVWHARAGFLQTSQWPQGQFRFHIHPGVNEMGVVRVDNTALTRP